MKRQSSYTDLSTLGRFAETAGRGIDTTRGKKHEMLLTFMANANAEKRRPAPARPRLLTALLSIFF